MRKILAAACVAVSAMTPAFGQQTIDNPMTKAMMEVYDSEIAAHPGDAELYFRRANEYYKFNQYLRALADVDKTLEFAPESNRDLRFQAYMLRADIYQMVDKHREALADFTEALKLDPASFMALYQKGNEEYELGDYAAAKASYTRLKASNPRSVEALTGLARVAVKENNLAQASEYMDGAVSMMSADSDIYIRRASVRRMQHNNTGAVEDLLMAISIDNNTRAFQELIDLANEDYPSVISGLSTSISYAPQQGMLYYIRAFVAQAHEHYASALQDYRRMIDQNMYDYAGLYNSMAQCQFALCKYQEAMKNVDRAISMDGGKNPEFYVTKAKIYYAMDRMADAQQAVKTALNKGDKTNVTREFEGIVEFARGRFEEANDLYASMIVDSPDRMINYILRGWVLNDGMKQTANAQSLYRRMAEMTGQDSKDMSRMGAILSYRGFALLYSGNKEEALKWGETLERNYSDSDGYLHYHTACLFAQAGEADKAFASLEKALRLGYGNLYEITAADYGRISLAPIRQDARFSDLLARYAHLFE